MSRRALRELAEPAACFLVAAAIFAGTSMWLRDHGYQNLAGLHRWAESVKLADTPTDVSDALTRSFPYIPTLLLLALRQVLGVLPPWTPVAICNFAGALIAACFYERLRRKNYGRLRRVVLIAGLCAHPLLLWPATSGDFQVLHTGLFMVFCFALMRVAQNQDARALMSVAAVCPLLLFCDGRAIFVLVAFLPLVPLTLPPSVAREGPTGGYIILLLPLALSLFSCAYVGWAMAHDPLTLFRTAFARAGTGEFLRSPWQIHADNSPVIPLLLLAGAALVSCPPLPWSKLRSNGRCRAAFIVGLLPLLAGALAQLDDALPHPAAILFLTLPCWFFVLTEGERERFGLGRIGTLSAGIAGAWLIFSWWPTVDMQAWKSALQGRSVTVIDEADYALGRWLASQPAEVLADDRHLDGVLAGRGHAQRMVMPGTVRFSIEINAGTPNTGLVVMHESSPSLAPDLLGLRFREPDFGSAPRGYSLVFHNQRWRVFGREGYAASTAGSAGTLAAVGY